MSAGAIPLESPPGGDDERVLSEQIAEELHRRILAGEIPLGSKLRQDAVAAEFQVSRTPVREAFRALQGQGVLEILQRRGALVYGPTARDIRDNHEVRAELEGLAAQLAADRIDDVGLDHLHAAVDQFDRVVDLASDPATAGDAAETWRQANEEFHLVLVRSADNPHLATSIQELRRRMPHNSSFATLRGSIRQLRANAREHRAVLEALEARDAKQARALLKAHVLRAGEMLARRYERELSGPHGSSGTGRE